MKDVLDPVLTPPSDLIAEEKWVLPGKAVSSLPARKTFKNQTWLTLLIAGVVILLLALIRPPSAETGLFIDQFWAQKLGWAHQFDVVLAGDSRVYRGLSPEAMAKHLPGLRIANFGFSSAGYGKEYLSRTISLLDINSKHKVMVFGITPNTLTEKSADSENGFLSLARQNPLDLAAQRVLGSVLQFFRPYDLGDVQKALQHKHKGYFQDYRSSGWVASYRIPENHKDALDVYRERWKNQTLSADVERNLLKRVSVLYKAGVRVYGFYPPTEKSLRQIENKMSGFDEKAFKRRFETAGGIWLDVNPDTYATYDASHLKQEEAVRLSTDLAKIIQMQALPQ